MRRSNQRCRLDLRTPNHLGSMNTERIAAMALPPSDSSIGASRYSGEMRAMGQASAEKNLAVRRFVALLAFATLAFLATQALGQAPAFKSDKLDPALLQKAASAAMTQARREGISKRDMTPQWERFKAFEAYYTRLVFGKLKDEEYLGELGVLTQSLLEDLDRANKSGSPAAALIRGYIIEMGKQIAPSNYHPAARINATLLLSLVDDAPEDPSNKKPPVPAAAAFGPLVGLYMKVDNPDGVRAAALQGIARHVALGAVKTPQYRAGVAKLMMELANSEPPAGRSPSAHAFMQRYAVDILNVLANPNASPDTAKTLVALSTDKAKPSLIAAYAASRIAVLQPGKATVDKVPEVLQVWAGRAADTIDGELVRIANLDPPVPVREQPSMPVDEALAANTMGASSMGSSMGSYESSMMGSMMSQPSSEYSSSMGEYGSMMMGPMGMPGMPGMPVAAVPKPPEVVTSLRRINHLLQQLQLGVTGQPVTGPATKPAGLSAAATPADKVAVDQWVKTVGEVVTAINADTIDDKKKLVEELTKQAAVLRALSGVKVAPGAAGNASLPGGPVMPGIPGMPAAGIPAAGMPAAGMPARNGAPNPANAAPPAAMPAAPAPAGVPAPGIAPPAPGIAPPAPGAIAPAAPVAPAPVAPVAPAPVAGAQPPVAGAQPPAAPQPAAGIPANPADLMNDL